MNSIDARIARLRSARNDESLKLTGNYMNAREFSDWLDNSKRGDVLAYHTGNLQFDRQNNSSPLFRVYHRLATVAYEAYTKGWVALVQRRVDAETCAYEAQRL